MFSDFQTLMSMGPAVIIAFFFLAVWSVTWKGFGLWIAAKENKKWWFVPILLLNTIGVLEIAYIFFFSETGKKYAAGLKKRIFKKKEVKLEEVKKVEETPQIEKTEEVAQMPVTETLEVTETEKKEI